MADIDRLKVEIKLHNDIYNDIKTTSSLVTKCDYRPSEGGECKI